MRLVPTASRLLSISWPLIVLSGSFVLTNMAPVDAFILPRLLVGIVSLAFIPGYLVVRLFVRNPDLAEIVGLSMAMGLAIQLILTLLLYALSAIYSLSLQFPYYVHFATAILLGLLILIHFQSGPSHPPLTPVRVNRRIIIRLTPSVLVIALFLFAVAVRTLYQRLSYEPATDGALYLEMARLLLTTGNFTSRVIDVLAYPPFNANGFSYHPFTYFGLAHFMILGGASYLAGKSMMVVYGSLVIFPVFLIARRLFSQAAGLFSGLIASVHPILLVFSSALFGPEMQSSLFALCAIYLLLTIDSQKSTTAFSFAVGLMLVSTYLSWLPNFYVIIGILPFILGHSGKGFSLKNFSLGLAASIALFALTRSYAQPLWLFAIGVFLLSVPLFARRFKQFGLVNLFQAGFWFFMLLMAFNIRTYQLATPLIQTEQQYGVQSLTPGLSLETLLSSYRGIIGVAEIYVSMLIENSTPLLGAMAFLALFLVFFKYRSGIIIFVSLFIHASFWSIFGALPTFGIGGIATRFLIIPSALLAIAVGPVLACAKDFLTATWMLRLKFPQGWKLVVNFGLSGNSRSIFAAILLLGIMGVWSLSASPLYANGVEFLDDAGRLNKQYTRTGLYFAVDWIRQNTPSDAVFLSREPREYAWYTERQFVLLFPFESGASALRTLAQKFRVSYLVVDVDFYLTYTRLRYIYENPASAPCWLTSLFQMANQGNKFIVYRIEFDEPRCTVTNAG